MSAEWNIQNIISWTTKHFESKSISSARLDTEVLLSHLLECKRLDLYLKFDQPLGLLEREKFKELVKRRSTGEPVAYILGKKEFYGRDFFVGPEVLIPRPETEHIIDQALDWVKKSDRQDLAILDVATGSGCLAATLQCEIPQAQVTALDISFEALSVASRNFNSLCPDKIRVIHSDFPQWVCHRKFDLIVSNPPYVAKSAQLMRDVQDFEPALALFGGEKGFEILLSWLPKMISLLSLGGHLLCEMGFDQKDVVEESFKSREDIRLNFVKDYSGHNRIIKIEKV